MRVVQKKPKIIELAMKDEPVMRDLRRLLKQGTNVNTIGKHGNTPLHLLIMRSNKALHYINIQKLPETEEKIRAEIEVCVDMLAGQWNIDVNVVNHEGYTPLGVALSGIFYEYNPKPSPRFCELANDGIILILIRRAPDRIVLDFKVNEGRELMYKTSEHLNEDMKRKLKNNAGKIFKPVSYFANILREDEDGFCNEIEHYKKGKGAVNKTIQDCIDGYATILQRACMKKKYKAVKKLLDLNADFFKTTDWCPTSPMGIMCVNGEVDLLKIMLSKSEEDIKDVKKRYINQIGQTPLHEIAMKPGPWTDKHIQCLDKLLEHFDKLKIDKNLFNTKDKEGLTALDYAVIFGSDDIVVSKILDKCDNIITCTNKDGKLAKHIPRHILQNYLDKKVTFHDHYVDNVPAFQITIDYNFLRPLHSSKKDDETETLRILAQRDDKSFILRQPVIGSFIEAKWENIESFFFLYILLNFILCTVQTVYLVTDLESPNRTSLCALIGIFLAPFAGLEIYEAHVSRLQYCKKFENYLEILIIALTIAIMVMDYELVDISDKDLITSQVGGFLILISWGDFLLNLGRHPKFSTNVTMLRRVSLNFANQLVYFILLVFVFATSFQIIFNGEENNPFPDIGTSLFKILVMFAGEYDASEMPFSPKLGASYFIFIVFVFLMSVVLINLLNGLAVTDINEIREESELYSLVAMTEFIRIADRFLFIIRRKPMFSDKQNWTRSFDIDKKYIIKKCGKYTSLLVDNARKQQHTEGKTEGNTEDQINKLIEDVQKILTNLNDFQLNIENLKSTKISPNNPKSIPKPLEPGVNSEKCI